MPNRNRRFSTDRGGFSLVELLIAVVILAAVVAPLLHAFVSSSGTAAKSRRLSDATLAAQNVAETIDATPLDNIAALKAAKALGGYTVKSVAAQDASVGADGTTVTYAAAADAAGADRYVLELAKDGSYPAVAVLNAAGDYAGKNAVGIAQYTPISAVFDQGAGSDPDALASAYFNLQASAITDASTAVSQAIERRINLTVEELEDGLACKYSYEYLYTCTATYTSTLTNAPRYVTWSYDSAGTFYDGSVQSSGELPAIYFFFNALDGTSFTGPDSVYITHTYASGQTAHPISVFLSCQNAATVLPKLRLWDQKYITTTPKDQANISTGIYCNLTNCNFAIYRTASMLWVTSMEYTTALMKTAPVNRIFELDVSVYETAAEADAAYANAVANAADATALFTLNATKTG